MTEQAIIDNIEGELNLERWFTEMGGPGSGHWRHAGRKGKRGGSAPSKGRGLSSKRLSAPAQRPTEEFYGQEMNVARTIDWFNEGLTERWEKATEEDRAKLKGKVAEDLSNASGVTDAEATDFVAQWAHSSNDDDMRSLAVQQDAAKEFGVELSDFTRQKITTVEKAHKENLELYKQTGDPDLKRFFPGGEPLMESDKQRALLRSMYNETQAELKSRGITEVRLSRGVGFPLDQTDYWKGQKGKGVEIETNSLESWSISTEVAGVFAGSGAGGKSKGDVGVVFETVVPADRILSTPFTGFGCLTEGEVIVLGGTSGDMSNVLEVY